MIATCTPRAMTSYPRWDPIGACMHHSIISKIASRPGRGKASSGHWPTSCNYRFQGCCTVGLRVPAGCGCQGEAQNVHATMYWALKSLNQQLKGTRVLPEHSNLYLYIFYVVMIYAVLAIKFS